MSGIHSDTPVLSYIQFGSELFYLIVTLGLLAAFAKSATALYKVQKERLSGELMMNDIQVGSPTKDQQGAPKNTAGYVLVPFLLLGLSIGLAKMRNV